MNREPDGTEHEGQRSRGAAGSTTACRGRAEEKVCAKTNKKTHKKSNESRKREVAPPMMEEADNKNSAERTAEETVTADEGAASSRHNVGDPQRGVVDVANPAPVPESMTLRNTAGGAVPTEKPLAAELLGQMKGMTMRQNSAGGARARTFGVKMHDPVARYTAPKTFAA